MLAAALLIGSAAATPAASPAAGYPLEAVLNAARALCASAPTVAAAESGPLPAQWRVVNPSAGSWLEGYREGFERPVTGATGRARALEAPVGGRTISAVIATIRPRGHPDGTTCEVIDREAVLVPDDARVSKWAGRAPATGRGVLEGLSTWTWHPGLDLEIAEAQVVYVTASAAKAAGLRPGLTYLTTRIARNTAP